MQMNYRRVFCRGCTHRFECFLLTEKKEFSLSKGWIISSTITLNLDQYITESVLLTAELSIIYSGASESPGCFLEHHKKLMSAPYIIL